MNRDRVEGKIKDVAGKAQREFGDATGNTTQQIKGGAKQVEGKIQQGVGKAKDAVDDTGDRRH